MLSDLSLCCQSHQQVLFSFLNLPRNCRIMFYNHKGYINLRRSFKQPKVLDNNITLQHRQEGEIIFHKNSELVKTSFIGQLAFIEKKKKNLHICEEVFFNSKLLALQCI